MTVEVAADVTERFRATVTDVDTMTGVLLDELEQLGLRDETIVISGPVTMGSP